MSSRITGRPALAAALIAVLYTRVSKDRSTRRKSVTEQAAEGHEAAEDRNWTVPPDAIFTDNDRSASRFATRPRVGWPAVLAYLRNNPVHVLIIWEVSRGDRRLGPWVALLDLCRDRGILIHVLKERETFDPRKPRDRKFLAQEGIEAEQESEKISERVKRDKRASARKGRPAGSLLYGYAREYDERGNYLRQVEHPLQAGNVRWIAEQIDQGVPLRAIARELNDRRTAARSEAWTAARLAAQGNQPWPARRQDVREAVRVGKRWDAPAGGTWSSFQVRQMILRPSYIAQRLHQKVVIGPADWPPILAEDLYYRVKARLTAPERQRAIDCSLTYQLSGAALCVVCRQPMRTLKRVMYRCAQHGCLSVSANMQAMDAVVDEFIVARLRQPDAAAIFAPAGTDGQVEAARQEERDLRSLMDEYYALAKARKLSPTGLAAMEADLLPQIEAAAAKVRDLSMPPALRGLDPIDLANHWADKPVHIRREVIVALAEIVLSPAGKGVRFTARRLRESRWRGDELTWGQRWEVAG